MNDELHIILKPRNLKIREHSSFLLKNGVVNIFPISTSSVRYENVIIITGFLRRVFFCKFLLDNL